MCAAWMMMVGGTTASYATQVNHQETTHPTSQTESTKPTTLTKTVQEQAHRIAQSIAQPKRGSQWFRMGADRSRLALQQMIDRCSELGGGTVELVAGKYEMDGAIVMKSGVCLYLRDGATLVFSPNPDAYLPVVATRWEGTELYGRSSMIYAYGAHDIIIRGEGNATINASGQEMARWGMPIGKEEFEENIHGTHGETPERSDVERLRQMGDDLTPVEQRVFGKGTKLRPCAIEMNNCQRILIEGIRLENSPFWCIHPLYCEDVTVRGVTIDSQFPTAFLSTAICTTTTAVIRNRAAGC